MFMKILYLQGMTILDHKELTFVSLLKCDHLNLMHPVYYGLYVMAEVRYGCRECDGESVLYVGHYTAQVTQGGRVLGGREHLAGTAVCWLCVRAACVEACVEDAEAAAMLEGWVRKIFGILWESSALVLRGK